MTIELSWNLILMFFVGVVVTYSLILDRPRVVNVILGIFVGVLLIDGSAYLLQMFLPSVPALAVYTTYADSVNVAIVKVLVLLVVMIVFAKNNSFNLKLTYTSYLQEMLYSGVLGLLSAMMLFVVMVIYVSGGNMIQTHFIAGDWVLKMKASSIFISIILDYYFMWFILAALAISPWSRYFKHEQTGAENVKNSIFDVQE